MHLMAKQVVKRLNLCRHLIATLLIGACRELFRAFWVRKRIDILKDDSTLPDVCKSATDRDER